MNRPMTYYELKTFKSMIELIENQVSYKLKESDVEIEGNEMKIDLKMIPVHTPTFINLDFQILPSGVTFV